MFKVIKLSDIKSLPVTHSGDEIRFNCPCCLELRGKEDHDAKLYYNERKRIGRCLKCDTRVIGEDDWSLDTACNLLQYKAKHEKVFYDLTEWSIPVTEGSKSQDYLLSRGLSRELISYYQFRESDHFDGIIIPNPIRDSDMTPYMTDFCQIRYFKQDARIRYLGIPGSKKPLYGSNLILPNSKLIVCEGVFSSIASYRRLGVPSIALYGKAMTDVQERSIKKLNPYCIILILDGKELRDIIEVGRKLSYSIKTYAVFLPYGKDPEEAEDLEGDIQNYCIEMNQLNIAKLEEIRYSYRRSEDKWDLCRKFCKGRFS